jgi:8-amino-7-oxononanoate synthase
VNFLKEELTDLEQRSLRRALRVVSQADGPRLAIGGRLLLNFSSNNYLGLARDPRVIEAVKQVLDHWGTGATSSRLISGSTIIHDDLEKALAAFLGTEAALLFPAGYMANLGAVTALVGPGDAIIMDRLCHASLVDAARLSGARLFVYRHADAGEAERALQRAASHRRRLLVTESLFSMDGDFAPLPDLLELARRYGAISLVDDAHALGIWGEGGKGLAADATCDLCIGTLSKALGSQGGFVAGSQEVIETLINRARPFIYSTGLSPACVAAAQAALSLVQGDAAPRTHLKELAARLREGLRGQGWDVLGSESQIVPILLGGADRALAVAGRLWESGCYAPAIRPPTVHAGQCRIRFSVTAEHSVEDIEQLLHSLSAIRQTAYE